MQRRSPTQRRLAVFILASCTVVFAFGIACGIYYARRLAPTAEPAAEVSDNRRQPLRSAVNSRSSSYESQMPAGVTAADISVLRDDELTRMSEHLDVNALRDMAIDADRLALGNGYEGSRKIRVAAITQLAKLDVDAALELCSRQGFGDFNYLALAELTRQDPARIKDMFEAADTHLQRSTLLGSIAMAETADAARLVGELIEQNPNLRLSHSVIEKLAARLAVENVEEAIAFAESMPITRYLEAALFPVLTKLGEQDPQRALTLMQSHVENSELRQHHLSSIAQGWMKTDPTGARSWIESLDDPLDVSGAIKNLSAFLGSRPDDRAWLGEVIRKHSANPDLEYHAHYLAQRWVEHDPQGAIEWVRSLPEGKIRQLAVEDNGSGGLGGEWAQENPTAAIAYLESLDPEDPITKYITRTMLRGWSYSDPAAAAAYAVRLEDEWARRTSTNSISSYWADSDPDAAIAWAQTIEEPHLRRRAQSNVISKTAKNAPAQAAAMLAIVSADLTPTQLSDFEATQQEIGKAWVGSDPQAAAEWALAQPFALGESKRSPVGSTFEVWVKANPREASDWLGTQAPSAARDEAAIRLIQRTRSDNREAAFAWATTLQDEAVAAEQLRSVVTGWEDPGAALQAISRAGLGEELRTQLESLVAP